MQCIFTSATQEDTRSSSPLEITQELTGAASLSQAMKSAGAEGEKVAAN